MATSCPLPNNTTEADYENKVILLTELVAMWPSQAKTLILLPSFME